MKRIRYWILVPIICALCLVQAGALELDTYAIEKELPESASEYLGELTPLGGQVEEGVKGLLKGAGEQLKTNLRQATASGFIIVAVCMLISLAGGFAQSSGLKVSQKVVDMTSVCAMMAVCFSPMGNIITDCGNAIAQLGKFNQVLIPVFAAASAISGKPVSAIASAGGTLFFSEIFILLCTSIFIPGLYLYIVVTAAGLVAENELLTRAAGFFKWLATLFLRGVLIAFTAYITLSGIITGSADAAAVKTAGVAISGVVPVVGSIISSTSEALLSGAAVLRGAVGIYGCLAACALCLAPFVRALSHMLIFKILAAVAAPFAGGSAGKMLDSISSAYSLALGILGSCCAIMFIAIVVSTVVCR